MAIGFRGDNLNRLAFFEHTANCCVGCSDPADWAERDELVWIGAYSHFCGFCATQDVYQSYIES